MKTVGGDNFPEKPLFFQQKLTTVQTGNSVDFKIYLIDPPIDAFDGDISHFGLFEFLKIPIGGGVTLKV